MKIKYLLIFLLLWTFGFSTVQAQCDANNFTITASPGTCPADGSISVLLPGGSPCNGWLAILTNPGGLETIQNIPSSGGPINFGSLAAGDYSVRLVNGATVIPYPGNPVQITTSYQTMDISSTNQAPSCPNTANLFTPDGTLEISINSGGTGSFLYEVTSQFGLQTFGPTTDISYVFGNMEGGESVSFTVTDVGCGVSQTQNPVINTDNDLASRLAPYSFARRCAPECSTYDADFGMIVYSQDRVNNTQLPGNATISINAGPPQDLAFKTTSSFISLGNTAYNITFTYPPGIAANDAYVVVFNDGCSTYSVSGTTSPIDDDFLKIDPKYAFDQNTCATAHEVSVLRTIGFSGISHNMFCSTNSTTIEQEISPGMWANVPLVVGSSSSGSAVSYQLPGSGHYRIIASDDCHTITKEFDTLPETNQNPLENLAIFTSYSILEGTGGLSIQRPALNVFATVASTTYQISPVPFTPSMTINPTHPYSLGGSYTLNFPISYTTTRNRAVIGDLPPGEYEIVATDICGNQATKSYTIQETAAYTPSIQSLSGCANSGKIVYDLQTSNVSQNSIAGGVEVELWSDNGSGGSGTLVQGNVLPNDYVGEFANLSDGNYILRFTKINFEYSSTGMAFSAATLSNLDREYLVPVTVAPFQNITATTTGAFCDINDSSSGIVLAEIIGGTPTYPMTYELYDASNLTAPLQTFTETDISVTNHIFENVSDGDYIVRITTPCDGLDLDLDLILAPIQAVITADKPILCIPGGDVELAINLPLSLFDISWTDDQGNTVGTGSPVTVSVATPTTYTSNYSLKSAFCPLVQANTGDILIDFHPDLVQVGIESSNCNALGTFYELTVEMTGTPPFTATGTGAPGLFTGNVWTSNPIPAGTDYNVSFEDANTCAILNVSDVAPNCCVFAVTCPTFSAMTVQCYADLPSATSLTEAMFEALGNADGLIGDPCGIIEIMATNSPNMGGCNQTVTRTYAVTKYEDTNANGVRDTGENVILNTLDCQQTITVADTTPPIFVENIPADITVPCTAIPEATSLTAIDNCDPNVQVSFSEETIFSSVTDDFIIERLWEVSDSCGNTEMFQQIVSVIQPEKETVTIEICIEDDPIDLIDSLPEGFDSNGVFEVASGNGILNGSLLDPSNFEIGEHQVSYSSVDGTCKYFVDFTVLIDADCIPCGASEIEISKTVTANADGVNDFFEIKGVEFCNYTFKVQLFNRWGKIVYESDNYRNDWSGFSPSNSFGSSSTLPSGTYYYIIRIKNSELKPINGFIYLGSD